MGLKNTASAVQRLFGGTTARRLSSAAMGMTLAALIPPFFLNGSLLYGEEQRTILVTGESIVEGINVIGNKLMVSDGKGKSKEFWVSPATIIMRGGVSVPLSDIKAGDRVTFQKKEATPAGTAAPGGRDEKASHAISSPTVAIEWEARQPDMPDLAERAVKAVAIGCESRKPLQKNEILIGYASGGTVYPIALVSGNRMLETVGEEFVDVKKLFRLSDGKPYKVEFWSQVDPHGDDHCVWGAKLGQAIEDWSLLSTSTGVKINIPPSKADAERFYMMNLECVHQGERLRCGDAQALSNPGAECVPEGETPGCVRPVLVATSDINNNGRPEFWHTQPIFWDIGLAVSELNEDGTRLKYLLSDCTNCSD